MLVSLPCRLSLLLAVGVFRYEPRVNGKCGYLCQCRQKGYQNENFRMLLQEEKEDLIDKCAQYKFRQFYPK